MKKINTENAPKALGPYSQAIEVNNFLFTSGQIAIDPKTSKILENDIKVQTERVIKNLFAIIEEAGYSKDNIIKTTCFLKDINDFSSFNEVYGKFISNKPSRSCVEISKLPLNALVEIEAIVSK